MAQPGLVPRFSGKHTNARVCGATGFIDHHTGYYFSSLQTKFDIEQTLAAKLAFEQHADTCDVQIKSYWADNGRFAEKSSWDSVEIVKHIIDFVPLECTIRMVLFNDIFNVYLLSPDQFCCTPNVTGQTCYPSSCGRLRTNTPDTSTII